MTIYKQYPIDISKKYGILLSGGLDSAVLLCMLIEENPSISIQPFTIPKSDGAMLYVNSLIKFVNEKFSSDIPMTIEVGDPTVYHRSQSKTATRDIFKNYDIDYLFIALNQNPPELNDLPGAPRRTTRSDNPKILLPFVNLLKTDILEIMYQKNYDDIIDLTHTCTEQQVGRCNLCWQCTERAWAFSKLGKVDTGTR